MTLTYQPRCRVDFRDRHSRLATANCATVASDGGGSGVRVWDRQTDESVAARSGAPEMPPDRAAGHC
jgi:hypothetical protein